MNIVLFVALLATTAFAQLNQPSCDSKVFCQGDLLHTIQMAQLFKDSKTFVDMKMKNDEATTIKKFQEFKKANSNPSKEDIQKFVNENFEEGNELENWSPPDYNAKPKLLSKLSDPDIRTFAEKLVPIWKTLGRKMKPEVLKNLKLYTLLYAKNGFIVPGGRFKEFYYWDTYWIIRGLLVCEMKETAKGMLENMLALVKKYGFMPNGARIYFLNRSQPPLLTLMVETYVKATNDTKFLEDNIGILEKEISWFENNRLIKVTKDGKEYELAHYAVKSGSPRPESYREDYETASSLKDDKAKEELYSNLKSGAESGWDFSNRWVVDESGGNKGNISSSHTNRINPVDLNSFLCQAIQILSTQFFQICNKEKASFWSKKAQHCRKFIHEVFYSEEDGIWYDFDYVAGKHRKMFYPSNFAPLWSEIYEQKVAKELGDKAAEYFVKQGLEKYKGGTPASLDRTGQQWDLPNAWPPLQSIIIQGLYKSGSKKGINLAQKLAKVWIDSNYVSYNKTGAMFEKYDAEKPGQSGGGGEYEVQKGFGWSNGVVFEFMDTFYTDDKNGVAASD